MLFVSSVNTQFIKSYRNNVFIQLQFLWIYGQFSNALQLLKLNILCNYAVQLLKITQLCLSSNDATQLLKLTQLCLSSNDATQLLTLTQLCLNQF